MPGTRNALDFELPDRPRRYDAVHLWTDAGLGRIPGPPQFTRSDGGWSLTIPTPPIDRLEYQFVARRADGSGDEHLLDPFNPASVSGAFGDKSELRLPGYRPPGWLDREPAPGDRVDLMLDTDVGPMQVEVWSPHPLGACDVAPLLLAHDGPEFDALAGLTHAVGVAIADHRLPPTRVALLTPGPRDERYAANDHYARALATQVVPQLSASYPSAGAPVLLGASLGALAALHAHWRHPGVFGGLFLASGSFFSARLDPQESGYSRFEQVTRFVREVRETPAAAESVRRLPALAMVCGTAEENLANNKAMRAVLSAWAPVPWATVRDGHCFTTWRDLLDPHLIDLLARAPR